MSEQISVTRALAEVKHLGDRISKAITGGVFVAVSVGKNSSRVVMNSAEKVEATEALIKSSKQSVDDLINRRNKLKAAIIKSNAVTVVKINDESMTVAEAIERKSSIAYDKSLLVTLNSQYATATTLHERARQQMEQKIEAQLNNLSGGDKNKLNEDSSKTVTEQIRGQFEPGLIDPLTIKVTINSLEKRISTFEQEVDFALSESNAKTTITV